MRKGVFNFHDILFWGKKGIMSWKYVKTGLLQITASHFYDTFSGFMIPQEWKILEIEA